MIKLKLLNQGEPNMNQPQLKTINIRGKEYSPVECRIAVFNNSNPRGAIRTEIIGNPSEWVFVRAMVTPDIERPERHFTGHSQAKWVGNINGQSALENAETSAIGRALASMGLGGGASLDEMVKCGATQEPAKIEEEPLANGKVIPLERPASDIKASEAAEIMEKWLIANSSYKAEQVLDFLAFKGYKFDDDDVMGDPLRLPENILKEVASKISKLTPAIKKWMKA